MKLFKYLGLLYCVAAALVLTAFGVHAAIEEFTGRIILPVAHEVYAALRTGDEESEGEVESWDEKNKAEFQVAEPVSQLSGDVKDVAIDLRQELKQIAEENQRWDTEVKSILQSDLQKNLDEISRQTRIARELRSNRGAVFEAMIPLLNGLMDDKEGWVHIETVDGLKEILGNAPSRITAEISVILTKELGAALQADDKKAAHARLKINVRQALSRLLEDYGVRVLDKAGRVAFRREAKRMLNNVQTDDAELRKPLRALRAHVLQVIIDRQEQSSL